MPRKAKPRCESTTQKGTRCTKSAVPGSKVCAHHADNTMVGRRSLIHDDQIVKTIIDHVGRGNYLKVAAEAAGIDEHTLHDWLAKGRLDEQAGRDSTLHVQFLQSIKRASATAETNAVMLLRTHFAENPKAITDFLSRRFPERWAQKATVQHGGTVQVDVTGLLGGAQPVDVPIETREKIVALLEEGEAEEVVTGEVVG